MGITLNPIDAIKTFISNKRDDRNRAGEYLEEIAREASELASIWQVIVSEIIKNGIYEVPEDIREKNRMLWHVRQCNGRQYCRLNEHFRQVSSVPGEKYKDEMDSIVFHIGSLLNYRNITKELVEDRLSLLSRAVIHHDINTLQSFTNLQESANALHREAAALHVRAQKFKAN